jgi:hypothetical protein
MPRKINLIVGDTGRYLSEYSPNSLPIFKPTETSGTYYLSLGDFTNVKTFAEVLLLADKIVYAPPETWSNDTLKVETLKHLCHWAYVKNQPIENLELEFSHPLINHARPTVDRTVWFSGCSITAGDGVAADNVYTEIFANHLNLPCVNLATSGASNYYAAKQILLSEIRKDDIVVFGVTSFARKTKYIPGIGEVHINPNYLHHYPICQHIVSLEDLDSKDSLYESISAIECLENFCRQTGAKLILLGLLTDSNLDTYLNKKTTFVKFTTPWIDLGNDRMHPGPKQHAIFATQAIEKYLTIY